MLYSQTVGQGKDLVLLHGWGFSGELFNLLIEQYKSQYRITTIDLPGHGRSDVVSGGLSEWCDEIIKILPNNPILLGWSLGGLLAIGIAKKTEVSGLILLASSPKFVQTKDWVYGIEADNFHQFADALSLNLSKGLRRFVSLQTQNKAQLKSLNQSIDALPASPKALNQGLDILLNSDLRHQFKQLQIPVQIILGNRDTLVPIDIAQWYEQQNIPVSVFDTGHLPFLHQNFKLSII
ncbi:Pimeloyl-[acyl-carrier protein] methyl ester esterase BioH (EC 3.1.1.85) [uncultured Gammaproteobacteria bacterium]|uniref:alpha/beta fold hydrolase n=1 Tax=Bathymodiolus heckerae thiotrophic gill symbiont TaxID=1052212 RepID=UPI0010BAB616|nr:alpha/beta fold hydrolase [Bathymodiolus heckerae thiotrophic gill symbiont]CAC9445972.1 Pimeloyl-[acyl-carrier protein] methyl ester esterase BioH (EC 3.1.1.85) [uncultured Gammaproteobacteria bacterium]CAC9458843.1 Pimeloyl-[acyl-carrier protein] methyl ester esterase BioH (EC 3.1.1.85) [uncultured Gammaproteobacteria bacterium]SMN13516.1 Biotin synthesis protein BioH [Bathymodiolus heckerae thiotrophic gill symbiont]SMN16509.1 Biotin synthesis protein BioH [uncultured Candidatus Thioglobu